MAAKRFSVAYVCLFCKEARVTELHECAVGLCTPIKHVDICRGCGGSRGDDEKRRAIGSVMRSFEKQFAQPKLLPAHRPLTRPLSDELRIHFADDPPPDKQ